MKSMQFDFGQQCRRKNEVQDIGKSRVEEASRENQNCHADVSSVDLTFLVKSDNEVFIMEELIYVKETPNKGVGSLPHGTS